MKFDTPDGKVFGTLGEAADHASTLRDPATAPDHDRTAEECACLDCWPEGYQRADSAETAGPAAAAAIAPSEPTTRGMHRAWPGPGVMTCTTCGTGVHSDASGALGWLHDDPALDTPPDTTPDGRPTVEERAGMTPIVRCGNCGSTRFANIGETSFTYQRTAIDTEDDAPTGDDYDSGDIEETWSMSVDYAECAECGTTPNDRQSAALGRAVRMEADLRSRVARILTAAALVVDPMPGSPPVRAANLEALRDAVTEYLAAWPEERRAEVATNLGNFLHG